MNALGLDRETPGFRRSILRDQGQQRIELLYADKDGNICIPYLDLAGSMLTHAKTDNPGNTMQTSYIVKRLANPLNGTKYENPKGLANQIYLTPSVIDAYQGEQKIETLYLVEGQFKALAGWAAGLHIVGISGYWGWKVGGKLQMKEVIDLILEKCKPDNLVLLLDADTRAVKREALEKNRDLAERLIHFHQAVSSFRTVTLEYPVQAYFAHVADSWEETAKGLDDLLEHERARDLVADVIGSLSPASITGKKNIYFQGLNLTSSNANQLKAHFRLHSSSVFYNAYEKLIGDEEFIYQRGRYKLDEQTGKVKQLRHPEAWRFVRVGCDYFKKITIKTQIGDAIPTLEPWKKGELSSDYPKDFIKMIEKYDAQVNNPCNNPDEYQEFITMPDGTRLLNLYRQPPHNPERGPFPHIWNFVKHIFGTDRLASGYRRYVLGIDWLTLLVQKPTNKLPIIVLVSEENETGKSTFIDLLMLMFGENVVRIGNDDIHDNYNAHYISKLVVGIEEGLIEKETIKEKIKALSTAPTANYEAKFVNKSRVDCILKFIITSNKPTGFMRLDPTDERFLVIQVPKIPKKDPHLVAKMTAEVPAFLYYLGRRSLKHREEGRMYFGTSIIITPEFERATKDSLPTLQKAIMDMVTDYLWQWEVTECWFSLKEITKELDLKGTDRAYLKKILVERMGLEEPTKASRANRPHSANQDVGRFYHFEAERYLMPSQLDKLKQLAVGKASPY